MIGITGPDIFLSVLIVFCKKKLKPILYFKLSNTVKTMALPPHVTVRYKPRSDGSPIQITTLVHYDQLMHTIKHGAKPYYISVAFETDFVTNTLRAYYNNDNKAYEFEYEDHISEKTQWISPAEMRATIAAYIPQLV